MYTYRLRYVTWYKLHTRHRTPERFKRPTDDIFRALKVILLPQHLTTHSNRKHSSAGSIFLIDDYSCGPPSIYCILDNRHTAISGFTVFPALFCPT